MRDFLENIVNENYMLTLLSINRHLTISQRQLQRQRQRLVNNKIHEPAQKKLIFNEVPESLDVAAFCTQL